MDKERERPLVCDRKALDPSERKRHGQVTAELLELVQTIEELEEGLRLGLPGDESVIKLAAEFIARERICCPFLTFAFSGSGRGEGLALEITGPPGTRALLGEAFEIP